MTNKFDKNIAVIGSGVAVMTEAKERGIVIINSGEEIPMQQQAPLLSNSEPYIISPQPLTTLEYDKPFKCKGKHQYREVKKRDGNIINSTWICQCGRNIND